MRAPRLVESFEPVLKASERLRIAGGMAASCSGVFANCEFARGPVTQKIARRNSTSQERPWPRLASLVASRIVKLNSQKSELVKLKQNARCVVQQRPGQTTHATTIIRVFPGESCLDLDASHNERPWRTQVTQTQQQRKRSRPSLRRLWLRQRRYRSSTAKAARSPLATSSGRRSASSCSFVRILQRARGISTDSPIHWMCG